MQLKHPPFVFSANFWLLAVDFCRGLRYYKKSSMIN